jgi:hypothetical protein
LLREARAMIPHADVRAYVRNDWCARADQLIESPPTQGAVEELEALRETVRAYLNGAPLDEHGRFKDARLEALYRAAGGQ